MPASATRASAAVELARSRGESARRESARVEVAARPPAADELARAARRRAARAARSGRAAPCRSRAPSATIASRLSALNLPSREKRGPSPAVIGRSGPTLSRPSAVPSEQCPRATRSTTRRTASARCSRATCPTSSRTPHPRFARDRWPERLAGRAVTRGRRARQAPVPALRGRPDDPLAPAHDRLVARARDARRAPRRARAWLVLRRGDARGRAVRRARCSS